MDNYHHFYLKIKNEFETDQRKTAENKQTKDF